MSKIALTAAALLLTTGVALAQQQPAPCAPYEVVAAALAEKYHETPVARMLADRGFVIEILASVDGTTFTALGIQANGTACILATGSTFTFVNGAASPAPGTNG